MYHEEPTSDASEKHMLAVSLPHDASQAQTQLRILKKLNAVVTAMSRYMLSMFGFDITEEYVFHTDRLVSDPSYEQWDVTMAIMIEHAFVET